MTNDSHLFRTAAQLESDGFYPVEGNRWKRGDELYLPLYQGRMIHQFDHRANSVRVNPENTHNPYLSEEVSEEQHADPSFLPNLSTGYRPNVEEKDIPPCSRLRIGVSRYRQSNRCQNVHSLNSSMGGIWNNYHCLC